VLEQRADAGPGTPQRRCAGRHRLFQQRLRLALGADVGDHDDAEDDLPAASWIGAPSTRTQMRLSSARCSCSIMRVVAIPATARDNGYSCGSSNRPSGWRATQFR